MKLEITKIEIGERLREVRETAVGGIAASFEVIGQLQPIIVRTDRPAPKLLAGAHRIEAAKKLGWSHIKAEPMDLAGMSKERADIVCSIVEVDENLARRDLDYAERLLSVDARVRLTEKRIVLEKVEAEAKAHAEAGTRKQQMAANNRKVRAEKTAKKVDTVSSPAGVTNHIRLSNDVVAVVAKETKIAPTTNHNVRATVKSVGEDALKIMAGTSLATKAEVSGLAALKKADPKAADDCIRQAAKAKSKGYGTSGTLGFSPSGRLGAMRKQENANKQHEATKTDAGCTAELLKEAQVIVAAFERGRMFAPRIKAAGAQTKMREWVQYHESMKAMAAFLRALAKPPEQTRGGDEHYRYPDEPQVGPTKAEVRTSLGKDAKSIKAKLKAKAKK